MWFIQRLKQNEWKETTWPFSVIMGAHEWGFTWMDVELSLSHTHTFTQASFIDCELLFTTEEENISPLLLCFSALKSYRDFPVRDKNRTSSSQCPSHSDLCCLKLLLCYSAPLWSFCFFKFPMLQKELVFTKIQDQWNIVIDMNWIHYFEIKK